MLRATCVLILGVCAVQAAAQEAAGQGLAGLLAAALEKNRDGLRSSAPVPLSYLSYRVEETDAVALLANQGALLRFRRTHQRFLDVNVAAGLPTAAAPGLLSGARAAALSIAFPLENDPAVVHAITLRETHRAWEDALSRLAFLRLAPSAALAPDALRDRAPVVALSEPSPMPRLNVEEWAARLRTLSAGFSLFPQVLTGSVALDVSRETRTLVDSTGSRLAGGRVYVSLSLVARGKSFTGLDLCAQRRIDAAGLAALPKVEVLRDAVTELAARLQALTRAADGEPYYGPVLLEPAAAAALLHAVLGRQLEAGAGAPRAGARLLPAGFHLFADPTLAALGPVPLFGSYPFDDEGVVPKRSKLVEDGVVKLSLAGRTTPAGADGHVRRAPGSAPAPRLSTLVLEAAQPLSAEQLRSRLIETAVRQKLPYAIVVIALDRRNPAPPGGAPGVELQTVARVTAGGKVSLTRGLSFADPVAALASLVAAGGEAAAYNALAAGQSGALRTSAVSPALLLERAVLTPLATASDERPPLLARPAQEGAAR